jgi:tetratricopeptide (TPR) repeat protein
VPVEASWSELFHDLKPENQLILRTCGVLTRASLSHVMVSAVTGRSIPETAELLTGGWARQVDDHLDIAPDVWPFVQRLGRLTPRDDAHAIVEKAGAAAERALDGAGTEVRGDVLGVLQAANRLALPHVAVRVARQVWRLVVPDPVSAGTTEPSAPVEQALDQGMDLTWWRAVATEGERAAGTLGEPRILADLLDRSARVHTACGDWQGAESSWIRALYLADKLGDDAEYNRYLELLATTYENAGQTLTLATTLVEMAERYEHGDQPEFAAAALGRLGVTMLEAGRPGTAVRYLERANAHLSTLPESSERNIRRAIILNDLGNAHARRRAFGLARSCLDEAFALADGVDQALTHRIRESMGVLPPA